MVVHIDLKEQVPVDIVKGAHLESTINTLFANFEVGEQRNAELVNKFFRQNYFTGEESLINKLIENEPNLQFNDIKDESINLALLQSNNNWMWDFKDSLNKITVDEIKEAFIKEIHDKVQAKIGTGAPYVDFNTKCPIPMIGFNVPGYFEKVVNYLQSKENLTGSKKTLEILKEINISNEDLNNRLIPTGHGIPIGINLSNPTIPTNIKNSFDVLLSFEIGKEASRTIEIANDFSRELGLLTTNTFPAINTIVGESDEYKYDEKKLGTEYQSRLQTINNDRNLSEYEKKKQIKDLKRKYYIKYLKTKNKKIGNALEQLYNNNFDYSKIDRIILKGYLDTVADIRFKKLFDKGINEYIKLNFGNIDEFKKFYMDIADVDPANPTLDITLSDVNIPGATPATTGNKTLHIQRKLVEGENEWLKDLDEFGKNAEKSFDALPIEYTINKSDIDALDITIEDKTKLMNFLAEFDQGDKYEIKGEKVGILIYLFFIINSRIPITQINYAKQKEVENIIGKAKNTKKETKENKDYTPKKFKKSIEAYGSGTKFENGSEIWLPMGNSELPGGGYQWMKIKISNIDMTKGTFEGKIFGGELKFRSNLEGQSKKFDMNEEFIQKLKKISKESDKIRLMPNPDKSDFNTFRNSLNGKLGTNNLSFPPSGVTRTGSKFMQKIIDKDGKEKEVEVKHFGTKDDDKTSYKIEYNQIRKSFTVSSTFNGEEKGKNGKSNKKRFSYKRDMDWNNFLIFFTQKGLYPQSEEKAENIAQKQEEEFKIVNGGHRKLHWFSFNNLKHGFKDIFGAIKKKMDDYNKAQDEKLRGIIEEPILNTLSKLPLRNSLKYAIGERQQEIYNEALNGAWKEIEGYLKALQSDGQFADTFNQVPPHVQTIYGKSYKKFIKDLFDKKGDTTTTEKRKAAALLLANYEKGGSPFRGLSEYENKGLRVKIILGEAHYQQFLRDKAACIRDRDLAESSKDSGLDKKGLNEQLATCEMDYIINNIRGAYPKLPGSYFPSHEKRGINGDESTEYVPNPSKRLLSEQFANKLEDAKKGWFTKGSVDDTYNKNKSINRFEIMEDDFGKAGSSRYKQAAGALRRMIDLASDEPLKKRMKKHFLTYLLSGILDVNCDPGLKKQIYGWAKPMMFVPGLLAKEAGIAENVAILLDDATNGDFSRNVTKYFHKKDQLDGEINFKGVQDEINNWLTDERMNKLDNYFSNLPTLDFSDRPESKRIILEKYQKTMSDSNRDEVDWSILENPKVVSNGLLSSVEVAQKRMNINRRGEFDGKDIDETNNMKDFRKRVSEDIEGRSLDERNIAFVLDKFFKRFGLDSQQIYEWIVTADFWNKNRGPFHLPHKGIELNMGNIGEKEINSILWYAFEGNAWKSRGLGCDRLPDELFNTLEAFREYFCKAFYNPSGNLLLSDHVIDKAFNQPRETTPLLMGSRDIYDQAFIGDSEFQFSDASTSEEDLFSTDDNKRRKAKKNEIKRILKGDDFINSDIVNLEKQLKKNLGGTSKQFPTVTSSQSRTSREEYLRGKLVA